MFPQNEHSSKNPYNSNSNSDTLLLTCPKCSRNDVHARLIKRKKKSIPAFRVIKKSVGDNEYEEKIPIKKKLNPTKAYNLFVTQGGLRAIKNPILYLPKLEREDIGANIRLAIELQKKIYKIL